MKILFGKMLSTIWTESCSGKTSFFTYISKQLCKMSLPVMNNKSQLFSVLIYAEMIEDVHFFLSCISVQLQIFGSLGIRYGYLQNDFPKNISTIQVDSLPKLSCQFVVDLELLQSRLDSTFSLGYQFFLEKLLHFPTSTNSKNRNNREQNP